MQGSNERYRIRFTNCFMDEFKRKIMLLPKNSISECVTMDKWIQQLLIVNHLNTFSRNVSVLTGKKKSKILGQEIKDQSVNIAVHF